MLFTSQGCAKWNKRHNHSHTPVFGTYPASAVQQPGLASVSPQSGPVMMSPTAQPQSANYPAVSPFAVTQKPMPDTPPLITNPAVEAPAPPVQPPVVAPPATPVPPPAAEPPAVAPAPVQLPPAAPAPAANTPAPAANTAPPAAKPAATLPPAAEENAKSATKPANNQSSVPPIESLLPPPATVPPPAELPKSAEPFPTPREQPKSTGSTQPATPGSPFANANTENKVANSQPLISLSIPGGEAPPAAPAEEKAPQLLAPPAQPAAPANSPGAGGLKPAPEPGIISSGVSKSASASPVAALDEALRRTSATLAQTTNYKVQVSNQETLNGKTLPADSFLLNARRQPFAVRMEWSNGKEAGREVIYSPTETGGMIQIR
ncbi:MAG: DUF1571 domain-containing protein, partial [Planctomycetota bacterium]